MKKKQLSTRHSKLRKRFLEEYSHSTPSPKVKKEKRRMYKFVLKLLNILK